MKTLMVTLAACALCLMPARIAHGQSITAEASVTGGYSTDDVSAVAAQLRLFGELTRGIRFFGETAWARKSEPPFPRENDSFAAAYPYGDRVQIIEAYAERMFRPRGALLGVRAGRFRTPFGIYAGSDHAYSGFVRAPLVRYEEYSVLSNYFLEHGVNVIAGVPRLTIETALAAPADVGEEVRRSGLDAVVRVQGYSGPFIVGVSHIRTSPTAPALVAPGRANATGVDVRWMRRGVQLRGEWVRGRPRRGSTSKGWYADVLVHRRGMGPVTAVARAERVAFTDDDHPSEERLRRQTIGVRVNLGYAVALSVNFVHQSGDEEEYRPRALDLSLTWSLRRQK